MKILKQDRQKNQVTIEIEEDYKAFEDSVEKIIAGVSREMKIPGFRPGKAPKNIVEKNINREAIEYRALEELISDLYPRLIKESRIEPVGQPKLEKVNKETGKPLAFTLVVDVYPEVSLGKYKGIAVKKNSAEISDDEVEKLIQSLHQNYARSLNKKPEDLPLDDEFAKTIGKFEGLLQLRQEIKKNLQEEKKEKVEAEVRDSILKQISQDMKADIPQSMIEREVDMMVDELKVSLERSNLALDDYLKGIKKEEKDLRQEMHNAAHGRVKAKLILRAVEEKEKILVTDEDIDGELTRMFPSYQENKANIPDYFRDNVKEYLGRQKALDFLVEKAKIEGS